MTNSGLLAFLAALSLLVPAGPAMAEPVGWRAAMSEAAPVAVRAVPFELVTGKIEGAVPKGAWILTGDHPEFGGFSGIEIQDGALFAITDFGWWLGADLRMGEEISLTNARMAPMRDPAGLPYSKAGGDAEDLTLSGSILSVSFERDHRIMQLGRDGRLHRVTRTRAFEPLPSNLGIEGLAAHPGGGYLGLVESSQDDIPVFRVAPDGDAHGITFHVPGRHQITAADIGPDGRLYVVRRKYSPLRGGSMRLFRYAFGQDGWPLSGSAEELAFIRWGSGIDNMEGISVERSESGGLRLWMISDDNFNILQRTMLVLFEIDDPAWPEAMTGQGGSG